MGSRRTEPGPRNKHLKVHHTNTANLQDPPFTKDQLDEIAKAASAKHLAKS